MTSVALKIALTFFPTVSSSSLAASLVTTATKVSCPLSAITTSVFTKSVRRSLIVPDSRFLADSLSPLVLSVVRITDDALRNAMASRPA